MIELSASRPQSATDLTEGVEDPVVDGALLALIVDVLPPRTASFNGNPGRRRLDEDAASLAPRVDLPADAAATPAAASAVRLRSTVQSTVQASSADLTNSQTQITAHMAARAYGETAGTNLDRAIPFLQAMTGIGLGAVAGFGVPGRSTGVAFADAGVRGATGNPEWDIHRPASPPPTWTWFGAQFGVTALEYAAGAVLGGAGNLLGQKLLAPLVNNTFRRTLKPIPAEVVVPDEMVNAMNALAPSDTEGGGPGTRLRAAAAARIASARDIDSDFNVRAAQVTFGLPAAVVAAVPRPPNGVAGAMVIGAGVSGFGGAGLGLAMATHQILASMKVPDIDSLNSEDLAERAGAMNPNTWKTVPLFFTHHKTGSFIDGICADVGAGLGFASWGDLGGVLTYRMGKMAQASWGMSLATLVPKLVSKGTDSVPGLQTVAAVSAAAGTYVAIRPWFAALAKEFPANDKAHRLGRAAPSVAAPEQGVAAGAGAVPPDDLEANWGLETNPSAATRSL